MQEQPITVFTANQRQKVGFFGTWFIMAKNMLSARELTWQLFTRDFINAYKKSFLGLGWVIVSPVIGILSWLVLNASGILNPGEVQTQYPVYVLVGSSIWGLFLGFYTSTSQTLKAGEGFITQVNYPHEALLVKQIAQHLANFSITFIINILVIILFGVAPSWLGVLLFPLAMLPLLFLGSAIGLVISVVSTVASDVSNFVTIFLGLVFYVTPVVYSSEVKHELLRQVTELNPLTYLVGGVRDLIIFGTFEHIDRFLISGVISFLLFLLALRLFYVSEQRVIERIS